MSYLTRDFNDLLGLPGFGESMLKDHFKLYEAYVKNTNLLHEQLLTSPAGPQSSELHRRFGWEFNGMRLHEYYFGSLSRRAAQGESENPLIWKISEDYGTYGRWEREFLDMGAIRGNGWVAMVFDPVMDRLRNIWINEHDGGLLAGTVLLTVMDVFEHAYMRDYGIKRDEYLAAFIKALDWQAVGQRFESVTV